MNKVMLIGRLGQDPTYRTGKNGGVTYFTLGVEGDYNKKKGKKELDWLDLTAFGQVGDFVANYCKKGDLVSVEATLKRNDYEKDGQRIFKTVILVQKLDKIASSFKNKEGGN